MKNLILLCAAVASFVSVAQAKQGDGVYSCRAINGFEKFELELRGHLAMTKGYKFISTGIKERDENGRSLLYEEAYDSFALSVYEPTDSFSGRRVVMKNPEGDLLVLECRM